MLDLSDCGRFYVSDFDALLARDVRTVPLTLRSSLPSSRPWVKAARDVLGVVCGCVVLLLLAAAVVVLR